MIGVAGGILLALFIIGLLQPTASEEYDRMLRERAREEARAARIREGRRHPAWWFVYAGLFVIWLLWVCSDPESYLPLTGVAGVCLGLCWLFRKWDKNQ